MTISAMMQRFFMWVFSSKFQELELLMQNMRDSMRRNDSRYEQIEKLLQCIDVSVDVHEYKTGVSWAVISLQGQKSDYVKFIELKDRDIREIAEFLRQYGRSTRIKIDASPTTSQFLKMTHTERGGL